MQIGKKGDIIIPIKETNPKMREDDLTFQVGWMLKIS